MSNLDLDICYLSASEALEKFKNKSLSPVELLIETIKRIKDVNPKIKAFKFLFLIFDNLSLSPFFGIPPNIQ